MEGPKFGDSSVTNGVTVPTSENPSGCRYSVTAPGMYPGKVVGSGMKVGLITIAWVEPSRKSAPLPVSACAAKTELQPDATANPMTMLTPRKKQPFDIRPPLTKYATYVTLLRIRVPRPKSDASDRGLCRLAHRRHVKVRNPQ